MFIYGEEDSESNDCLRIADNFQLLLLLLLSQTTNCLFTYLLTQNKDKLVIT